jgi:magnesium transporter
MFQLANERTKVFADFDAKAAPASNMLAWLDLRQPSKAELEAVISLTGAPAALLDIAADMQTSLQADQEAGWLLLVTRVMDRTDGGFTPQNLGILVGEKHLITLHETDIPEFQEVFHEWKTEPIACGPDLLYYLMDALLDCLFPMLDDIEENLYQVEESIVQNDMPGNVLQDILRSSRQLLVIRKVGSAIRESTNAVLRHTSQRKKEWARFQEIYDHATRVVDTAEILHEVSSNSIDAHLASVSNQLNGVMKTLTIMATILMTVSLISGIFGMNFAFPHLIKDQSLRGFWFAVGAMGASVAGLLLWFKKKRYF